MGQPAPSRDQHPGTVRMLVGDAYIATRLFKEALHRITGIPRDASFLTTLFTIGVLANALGRVAARALRVFRPRRPSLASTMMAGAVLREIPGSAVGVRARVRPLDGTLIAISLVAPAAPSVRRIVVPVLRLPAVLAAFFRGYRR